MKQAVLSAIVLLALAARAFGQAAPCPSPCPAPVAPSKPHQIITTSWPGLSGFFVTPTARLIGQGNLAIGFNESKHSEHFNAADYTDRQIRAVTTYGILEGLEVSYAYYNDMYVIDKGMNLNNHTFSSFGLKLRLMKEDPHYWFPEVSLAVRDIGDQTRDIGKTVDMNNGRKAFLLASKRLFKDDALGRFMDINAGLTWDDVEMSGLVGFELTIAPNASLIVESMWDSPYLNFRTLGQPNHPGRYIFDPGIRFYPELVPNLVLDLGFVGDGEFEFSFGASYVAHL